MPPAEFIRGCTGNVHVGATKGQIINQLIRSDVGFQNVLVLPVLRIRFCLDVLVLVAPRGPYDAPLTHQRATLCGIRCGMVTSQPQHGHGTDTAHMRHGHSTLPRVETSPVAACRRAP